jgi:DNA-binding PadR family transcriptional regulator
VNPTRLFVLGALARHGPMYGHQIRRDARVDRTELWSEVRPGSLYSALHRLQAEGLIEPVRTEQQGNLPARTVYAITGEGRRELRALREEALREVTMRPDPVDLALAMSADLDEDTLRGYFASRREALSSRAAFLVHERGRVWPDQAPADDLIMEHAIARVETELRWHDAVLARIGKLAASAGAAARRTTPAGTTPAGTAASAASAHRTTPAGAAPAGTAAHPTTPAGKAAAAGTAAVRAGRGLDP